MIHRRRFLASAGALAVGTAVPGAALPAPLAAHGLEAGAPPPDGRRADLTVADLERAEKVQGLAFTPADRELMLDDVDRPPRTPSRPSGSPSRPTTSRRPWSSTCP